MKHLCHRSVVWVASLLTVLVPVRGKADLWDVPAGLAPGDTFRWVFITSTRTGAQSADITYYNNFVNALADTTGTSITGVAGKSTIAEIEWKAIASVPRVGSVPSVSARENVGATSSEIYLPDGILVADGTADLFDGRIRYPIRVTETGSILQERVWTGTLPNGDAASAYELGAYEPIIGVSSTTSSGWITAGTSSKVYARSLYAISEELTVAPIPGAMFLGVLGLGFAGLKLRRIGR